jgi:hypothetical protein
MSPSYWIQCRLCIRYRSFVTISVVRTGVSPDRNPMLVLVFSPVAERKRYKRHIAFTQLHSQVGRCQGQSKGGISV